MSLSVAFVFFCCTLTLYYLVSFNFAYFERKYIFPHLQRHSRSSHQNLLFFQSSRT
ncbi:uncharacterized protein DS421_1g03040 [Arachis hypogaea]|nr:uncharacterized protein DS421_1g03040 [Arachis hypogaea]